jgi:hypothetical protein
MKMRAIGSWYPTRSTPYPAVCSPLVKTFCEILFWSEQEWRDELARSPHHYRLFKSTAALWQERYH